MKKVKITKIPSSTRNSAFHQKGYALDRPPGFTESGDKKVDNSGTLNKFIKESPREEANIEAEGGETVLADFIGDGTLQHMDIGGKKHYAGGTPIAVPQGAFIFSDTPKMKLGGPILAEFGKHEKTKKEYTPAKLAKQYDLNFYKDKSKKESDDKIAVDTAELMYENGKQKLGKLAFVQEALKGFPTGIPGVTQQIQQEGQQAPEMRYGGKLPKAMFGFPVNPVDPYLKAKTKQGSVTPTGKSSYYKKGPEYLQQWESLIPGISGWDNKKAQEAIYDHVSQNNPSAIDNMWTQYGLTRQGRNMKDQAALGDKAGRLNNVQFTPEIRAKLKASYVDGMFGARQLDPTQPAAAAQPNPVVNSKIPTIPIAPAAAPVPGIRVDDPNFKNTPETTINPNAFDVMGFLHAATRPIDHIRPQLTRVNAQVSDPTFMDNRATIQQLQSVAADNNNLIQNTSSGQVARANAMGNAGKLFDPINSSNQQTHGENVGIENQFKQYRDGVNNTNAGMNLELLGKFIANNDMYRANLTKEKQLKFNDTMEQGHNMVNNMLTMGSILERTPNFTVNGPFWNPSFKPGVAANINGGGGQSGSGQDISYADLLKEYKATIDPNGPKDSKEMMDFYKLKLSRRRTTTKGLNTIPNETQVEQYN